MEKVAQKRGNGVASAEVQVTARQGGESTQICWHISGVGMLGVMEVMREESQVVLAVRQEGRRVEAVAEWRRRSRRRGAIMGNQNTKYVRWYDDFIGKGY